MFRLKHINNTAALSKKKSSGLVLLQALHVPLDKQQLRSCFLESSMTHTRSRTAIPLRIRYASLGSQRGAALDTVVYQLAAGYAPHLLDSTVAHAETFYEGGSVASLVVSSEAFTAAGATVQDADGLVEFLRNVRSMSLAVLLARSRFRLSLRSDDTVDSTVIAAVFGGGEIAALQGVMQMAARQGIVQAFRSWRREARASMRI